ncbi:MAG TPA: lamin tail domain-containing protein, partial [Verrucomicrobiae bacterium]|nr:lamin tail domain-containing protein [Verrucomicrobiae bacterium]
MPIFARLALCAAFYWVAARSYGEISINEILADNKEVLHEGTISDWVEVYNPSGQAASLNGYSLTDSSANPRKWIFPTGVSVPATGFLVVHLDSSRPASAVNMTPLNTGFSIKGTGDRIELYSPTSQLVESVRFGPQAIDYSMGRVRSGIGSFVLCSPTPGSPNLAQVLGPQAGLRINEWMASPSSGKDWFELYNPSTLPVQLSGLFFTDEGNTPSPVAPYSFIGTGVNGYVRFFADNSTNDNEATFKLGGGGDSVFLFAPGPAKIDGVSFGQQTADVSQGRLPDGTDSVKELNTPTPGESNLIRYEGLVINEVLTHTDPPLEDAVELYNQTPLPIDISGWYLSNSRTDLKRYRLPNGSIVPAKGYFVLYEGQFNSAAAVTPFTFNAAHGDQVYLAQAAANGDLTGYIVFESFEAAENGASFGRFETSVPGDYKFVAMQSPTFGVDNPATQAEFRAGGGRLNSPPRVGPVVINEIMYNPPPAVDGSD